ncbi:MAG: M20/M25/M40 family metallo-hydrolase, partial [Gemmatimonadetes bacterium]|nr:M20/M25/M40 family metallo-hydrolase [Gemmatimonadota bacterium]
MALQVDQEFITHALQDLVRINSINPTLEAGGPGEAEIAVYVARTLRACGLEVTTHESREGRVSVVGRLEGRSGRAGRSLMLNAHLDTVGVAGMAEPFSGAYGRGSYDMKGSLAAMLGAAKALAGAKAPFQGSLLIAGVADEENASIGTMDLIPRFRLDAAIVTEPTHLEVCLAHKGFAWIDVTTEGRAAHGSRPDLGLDANLAMGKFLARLAELERELRSRHPHPLVGPPSLHAGVLRGGTAPSVYAASSKLTIERRMIPGETRSKVVEEIAGIIEELTRSEAGFRATHRLALAREPFEVAREAEIVRSVARAVEAELGTPARYGGQ